MDLNRILLNIVPFLSLFTLLGWLAWLWFERQASLASMRAKTRNAFYNQLLERLSTANEFIEFLESEKGRELMKDLAPERARRAPACPQDDEKRNHGALRRSGPDRGGASSRPRPYRGHCLGGGRRRMRGRVPPERADLLQARPPMGADPVA